MVGLKTGRPVSSSAKPQNINKEKNEEKNTNAASWGGKKTEDYPQRSNERFPWWPTGLQNIPTHLGGGEQKLKNKKKFKNRTPIKTQASCTFQTILNWSLRRTTQSRSSSRLPLSFGTGPCLISEITINWAGHLECFRPVADDHLCLCVFFFRFRLKKQQHLGTETDVQWTRTWGRCQMKLKKEKRKRTASNQCVKNPKSRVTMRTAAAKRFD